MQIENVVDFIFSTNSTSTVIGAKLKEAAKKKTILPLEERDKKEYDFRMDIRDIITYNNKNNCCWVDYRSWITMPKCMQDSILKTLNPKTWRGVLFQYDLFLEHEKTITKNIHQDIVLVLSLDDQKKYRIYTIPLYKSYLDWMTPTRFKDMSQKISKNMIKTYGRHKDTVYILDNKDNLEEFSVHWS